MAARRTATSLPSQSSSPEVGHVTRLCGFTFAPPPPTACSLASPAACSPSPFAFSSATSDVSTTASTAVPTERPGKAKVKALQPHHSSPTRPSLGPQFVEDDVAVPVFGEHDFDGDTSDYESDADSDGSDYDGVAYPTKGTTIPITDSQAQLAAAQRAIDIARSHIATPTRAFAQSHAATPVAPKLALDDLDAPIAEAQRAIAAANWRILAAAAVIGA